MDEMFINSLDHEFKQYLDILRPQLGQLKDRHVISTCNMWIQRLSRCNDSEKILRNKYVLKLCYQLTKGNLQMPFLREPTDEDLSPISEPTFSEITSEVECLVIDSEDLSTKVLFDKKASTSDSELLFQDINEDDSKNCRTDDISMSFYDNVGPSHKQSLYCFQCPEIVTNVHQVQNFADGYEHRTNNIISKLRAIKKQNQFLHNELHDMRERSEGVENKIVKVNNATSAYIHMQQSNSTIKSLNCKLKDIEDERVALIDKIQNLQEIIDNFDDLKKHEIETIDAKYKLELISIKSTIKEEFKQIYETKLDELEHQHELALAENERKRSKDIQELTTLKNSIIAERDNTINLKDSEIAQLLIQINDNKDHFHAVLEKNADRPGDEKIGGNRIRNELEKRLEKLEKSKNKCIRVFEAKFASLQRENHLAECSFQLQLVRQRAQVVSDVTDENQTELKNALDKLEAKYKDIVANMQATAIQRRVQDQMAVESILKAACGIQNDTCNIFPKGLSGNRTRLQKGDNYSYVSEVSALIPGNKKFGNAGEGSNKLFCDRSGCCVNGQHGVLFEKVHVPQRDTNDKLRK